MPDRGFPGSQERWRAGWPNPGCAPCSRPRIRERGASRARILKLGEQIERAFLQDRIVRGLIDVLELVKERGVAIFSCYAQRGLRQGRFNRGRIGEIVIGDLVRLRNDFGIVAAMAEQRKEAGPQLAFVGRVVGLGGTEPRIFGRKVAANPGCRVRRAPPWLRPLDRQYRRRRRMQGKPLRRLNRS